MEYTRGVFRAFLDMNIGVMCVAITKRLEKYEFNKMLKILFSILEVISVIVIYDRINSNAALNDYDILWAFSIVTIMAYLKITNISRLLDRKFFIYLGRYSYGIYLNHLIVSAVITEQISEILWWKALGLFIFFTSVLIYITCNLINQVRKYTRGIEWIRKK